jgi:hypothetical protein
MADRMVAIAMNRGPNVADVVRGTCSSLSLLLDSQNSDLQLPHVQFSRFACESP